MKNRIISALLCAVMLLGLCACGGGSSEPADPNLGLYEAEAASAYGITIGVEEAFPDGFTVELKAKGKCRIAVGDQAASGSWTLDGTVFHCEAGGVELDGTLKDGVMFAENVRDSGIDLTLVNWQYDGGDLGVIPEKDDPEKLAEDIIREVTGEEKTEEIANEPPAVTEEPEPDKLSIKAITPPWTKTDEKPSYTVCVQAMDGNPVFIGEYERTGVLDFIIWNIDGEELFRTSINTEHGWGCMPAELVLFCAEQNANGYAYRIYDYSGDIICTGEVECDATADYIVCTEADENGLVVIYGYSTRNVYRTIDIYTGEEASFDDFVYDDRPEYDEDVWDYCEYSFYPGYLFVGNDSVWGFLTEDGDTVAMYDDCSDFNLNGYALASLDCENYFVIDTNGYPASQETLTGCIADACANGVMLSLEDADGNETFYLIG